MGLFWCKKRQLTPSSDVYAAMFYEFISSLFPVFSSDTTLHNTRRFARIHAVSRWDCQSIFTPTQGKIQQENETEMPFLRRKTDFRMFFLAQTERRSERGNETQNLFCNKAEKIHGFHGM